MAKKQKIDYSEDRLLSIASGMLDDHNYLGALKMLNRNVSLGGYDSDTYMLYAEAFDDMGLLEKCINKWFAYIDNNYTPDSDLSDAYEGLAMAYMNYGRSDMSAFYYDRLLKETGGISEADRADLLSSFLGGEKNPLKIVSPPEKADFTDTVSAAMDKMRAGDFDAAVELLKEVPEGNPEYINARNYIAMSYIISDRYPEAESECLGILERDPGNIQAMISYTAVKNEQGDKEASCECTRKLLEIETDNTDDIYKIATVCCENGMHAEAYDTFCKLGDDMQYDFNMLYFKAIAAFNCGKRDKAKEIMQNLLIIYPAAYTARRVLADMREAKEDCEPFSYYYRLPVQEREHNIKLLISFDKCNKTQLKSFGLWDELRDVVMWCIDEADSRTDADMIRAAAGSAIKARFDDIVRDLLLNAFISDETKIGMLHKLCERNEDNNFGVVCCHIYRSVDVYAVNIGRTKRKIFLSAYADLVCRFALIDNDYSHIIADACETLYERLEARGKLGLCTDDTVLMAAIFASSDLKSSEVYKGNVCAFFGADSELFNRIMEE